MYKVKMPTRAPRTRTPKRATAAKPAAAKKPTVADKALAKPEVRIFVSYSHQDAGAQQKLHTHLAPWRRDGVTVWYDENIEPGAALGTEIARELRRAHIFVALFSPAYLDSNYCWNIEYRRAMGRRARKLLRVVAVVVKPCGWKQTPAAGFKLLPKDGVPPERWSSHDAAFVDAARGIGEVIGMVRRELATAAKTRTPASKPAPKAPTPKKAPAAKKAPPRKRTAVASPAAAKSLKSRAGLRGRKPKT